MENAEMAKASATPAEQTGLSLTGTDELAGLDLDFEADGLGEVGGEDIRIPKKLFNLSGKKGDVLVRPDQWFDNVEETVADELDLAMVDLTKSNLWQVYDDAEGRNATFCRSYDRITGVMQATKGPLMEGQERPCKGCPQSQWRTDDKGKRNRECGPAYDVLAVDRAAGQPCVIRFKRTSLSVIKAYLNRHHINKRVVNGRRASYPLFVFQVTASLEMGDNGKYALPVLTRGDVLTPAEIKAHEETAKVWRETILDDFRRSADAGEEERSADATGGGSEGHDASDFVDDDAEPSTPNRF